MHIVCKLRITYNTLLAIPAGFFFSVNFVRVPVPVISSMDDEMSNDHVAKEESIASEGHLDQQQDGSIPVEIPADQARDLDGEIVDTHLTDGIVVAMQSSPLWRYFYRGAVRHKRSGYKSAYCKACINSTSRYEPMRGDPPRMWKHLGECPYFDRAEYETLIANGQAVTRRKKKSQANTLRRDNGGNETGTHSPEIPSPRRMSRKTTEGASSSNNAQETVFVFNPLNNNFEQTHYFSDLKLPHRTLNLSTDTNGQNQSAAQGSVPDIDADFVTFLSVQFKQYPEPVREKLKNHLKKEMAKFYLNYMDEASE